jgi:outer membrane protein, heavy metal efflux system
MNFFRAIKFSLFVFFSFSVSPFLGALVPSEEGPLILEKHPLTFEIAYNRVLGYSLSLKVYETEVQVREAKKWQAGIFPNPELSVVGDDLGGSDRLYDNEVTVAITQLFELGGKRAARIRMATSEQCIAEWELEIKKIDLFTQLMHAFIDAAAAQEALNLAEEQKKVAEDGLQSAMIKVAHGKVSSIEQKKAEVIHLTSQLTLAKKHTQAELAKKNLASLWGSQTPDFDTVLFPLYDITPPLPFEELVANIWNTPDMAKSDTDVVRACDVVSVEKSYRIPDVAITAGVNKDDEETTYSIAVNIPIPIFDRNQGNILRANLEQQQAEFERIDLEQSLKSKLQQLYENLQAAFHEALALKETALSAAEETFRMAQQGYREGKFEYLDMLDARKTLFELKQHYLDVVTEYQHKKADVQRLAGKS